MRSPRVLLWHVDDRPVVHPYRDTLIVYGALALVIVLAAVVTGGDVVHAVLIAVFFYAVATAWSLLSWRRRLRRQRAQAAPAGVDE